MGLKNRLRKAAAALLTDPDRVVYLFDSEDGEQRIAVMENKVCARDSDAHALHDLASGMPVDEDYPGVSDKLNKKEREETET